MAHHGSLADKKAGYLEIGEFNFSWPAENGTYYDIGSLNYTLPSGTHKMNISLRKGYYHLTKIIF